MAYLLTGDVHGAEDLAQVALIRTYLAWRRVRRDDAFRYARKVGKDTWASARFFYRLFGPKDPMWKTRVADPGRRTMFGQAVYFRGGMTLAVLRHRIGDSKFFELLQAWASLHRYGNATTRQFTELASQVAGRDLQGFFRTWLWQPVRPRMPDWR